MNYCAVQAVTGVVTLSTYNRWNLYPHQTRDIAPRQLYWYSNISRFVLCSQISIQHIYQENRTFPIKMWSYHHCWRGLVFFLSPDTNPVIKCFTFLLTIPHCRQSLSPQLLTKVKGSECLQIETHNSELIITLYSYLESGFWIVIVITSGLKIQNIFHLPSSQLWSSGKMLRQEKYFSSISCEYK